MLLLLNLMVTIQF